MHCVEKNRLLMELSRCVLAHCEAVTAIGSNIGTAHEQLQATVNSARLDFEEKRRQLYDHLAMHGCQVTDEQE